jgi:hypothetical protein
LAPKANCGTGTQVRHYNAGAVRRAPHHTEVKGTYGFLAELREDLVIDFIHGLEVDHWGDENTELNNASKATTSCFEYSGQVL